MTDRPEPDPYANLRHLEGGLLGATAHELLEDADGNPLGVDRVTYVGRLRLPPLPAQEDQ